MKADGQPGVRLLGPAEAPIPIIRSRHRWQIWLASTDRAKLNAWARLALGVRLATGVRLAVDVDPQSVL